MLSAIGLGYDEGKMKPNLKQAAIRCKIISNKKTNALQTAKKEVARLLEENKEEKARIQAEALIREDFTIEALEIVELHCNLIHDRMKYVSASKVCPVDISEAVNTLIWVADKIDIPELVEVKKQFRMKYGSAFKKAAKENIGGIVNERVVNKLTVRPPSAALIVGYLQGLATEYGIDWQPCEVGLPNDPRAVLVSPVGFSIPMAPGSGLAGVYTTAVPPLSAREETAIRQKIEDLTIQKHTLQDELALRGTGGDLSSSSIPTAPAFPVSVSQSAEAATMISIPAVNKADTQPSLPRTTSQLTFVASDNQNPGNTDAGSQSFEELELRFASLRKSSPPQPQRDISGPPPIVVTPSQPPAEPKPAPVAVPTFPLQPPPQPDPAPAVPPVQALLGSPDKSSTNRFKTYDMMRKMLPEGAVRQKMKADGVAEIDINKYLESDGANKSSEDGSPPQNSGGGGLLAGIQAGVKLKVTEKVKDDKPKGTDSTGGGNGLSLMDQLKGGVKLKKASEASPSEEHERPKSSPQEDIMKGILQGATRLKKVTPPPTEEKREENGQGLFKSAVDKILARRSMVKSDSLNEEKDGEWD